MLLPLEIVSDGAGAAMWTGEPQSEKVRTRPLNTLPLETLPLELFPMSLLLSWHRSRCESNQTSTVT